MAGKKLDLMHHGDKNNVFSVTPNEGSDYFHFTCTNCNSLAAIYGFMFDSAKRVIFNLKCRECGAQNVRKITLDTSFTQLDPDTEAKILISNKHKDCLTSKSIVN